jgi:hypothetical protein
VQNRPVKAFAFALMILIALRTSHLFAEEPLTRVTPDAEWNAVFDRTDGWTGADCAGSVDLGDGRTLWMFGDTWIGKIRDGKRQPGATMVNNSIAVHPTDKAAPWRAPDPRRIQFLWGPQDKQGRPTAWVVPPPIAGQTESGEDRDWFWCNGGGIVTTHEPEKSRRLFVFLFRVRRDPHGKGVWAFTTVGTSLAVVDNVSDPPQRWRPRIFDIPRTGRMAQGSRTQGPLEILWGMSAIDRSALKDAGGVLIFGTRLDLPFVTSLIAARAPGEAIERFDDWRFCAGPNAFDLRLLAARPLAKGLVSEFSVEKLEDRGRPIWVLVQSEAFLGKRILVRTAPQPEGAWSAPGTIYPGTIYTVPEVVKNHNYFTYAAKGHASLSRPGELLVTYLVNSQNFGDLVTDTTIYRPKFLRVPAAVIFGK